MVKTMKGFTIIELMIVVAIIGILAAIAYPNYQNYVIKTKRADMMTELTAMAGRIESEKLAKGSYTKVTSTNYAGAFPKSGAALYNTSLNINAQGWTLTAAPVASGMMAKDGALSYNNRGVKCRGTKCGSGDEWRD